MGFFGNIANARAKVKDQDDARALQDQVRNDAIRQKTLEMALQIRAQNETGRHNLAGETESTNQFGEAKRHNQATEGATATGQAETGRHNTVEERIAQMRERRESLRADKPNFTFTPGTDPESGQPTIWAGDTHTGTLKNTGVGKPVGGLGGSGSAQTQKNKALLDLMEQGYPVMEQLSAKVRPERITAAIKYPTLGNPLLNQDEQNYMAAFRNYLAGILHVESGARLSKDQLMFGMERYAPMMGDTDETKRSKLNSARMTLEARRKEFGGDATHANGTLPGPSTQQGGQTHVKDTPGDVNLGASSHAQSLWDAAVAKHGKAKVLQEYGPRPQ